MIVNKDGLARFLRMSLPTLRDRLAADPEIPVVRRGSNGVPWEFDAHAVQEHFERRARERAEAEAQRRAQLDAIRGAVAQPGVPRPPAAPLFTALAPPAAEDTALAVAERFGRMHELGEPVVAALRAELAALARRLTTDRHP
jgi:phage terminase Nu1 subunit (DNA packaging protein)